MSTLLVACGGSSSDNPTLPVDRLPTLSGGVDAIGDVALVGIRTTTASGDIRVEMNSGTFNGSSQALALNVSNSEVVDDDGPISGTYVGSQGATISPSDSLDDAEYDYLTVSNISLIESGNTIDVAGIWGISTPTAEIDANSGSATYVGEASADYITTTQGFALSDGTSETIVDFQEDLVTVTMTGFTVVDIVSGINITAPFDTVVLNDLSVGGSGFQGSDIELINAGALVDPNGTSLDYGSGQFFGLDADGDPSEVGGVFISTSQQGILTGQFIGR